ncbi:MAG: hypothetical protein WB500_14635 [Rhodoplanes sp.]
MYSNGTVVAKRDPINHVKIIVLAALASLIIMLIGIGVQSTEDVKGYGVVWSDVPSMISAKTPAR